MIYFVDDGVIKEIGVPILLFQIGFYIQKFACVLTCQEITYEYSEKSIGKRNVLSSNSHTRNLNFSLRLIFSKKSKI